MPLLLLHFLVILLVGLAVWDMYGMIAALVAVIIVSVPFIVLFGIIHDRFVQLIVRDV